MIKLTFLVTFSMVLACICAMASHARSQNSPQVSSTANVITDSPEFVIAELYAALSFASGKGIDRKRVGLFFVPDARILFAGGNRPDNSSKQRTFSVESFLDFATSAVVSRQEQELWRRVERFGNIAHVFSAYELSFKTKTDDKPTTRRGINSVQLSFDGSKWRIVSLIWDVERPGNPLSTQRGN